MIKTILLTGILFFVFVVAKAQEHHSRLSVEVSVGPSFPVGKFASKDTANIDPYGSGKQPGWAKTGVGGQIVMRYQLTTSFGIILLAGGQLNTQDRNSLDKDIKSLFTWDKYARVESKTSSWKTGKVMAGGFFLLPIAETKELLFQGDILAGVCKTSIPKYSYTVYDDSLSIVFGNPYSIAAGRHSKITLPLSFCFQLSAGLKYFFTQKVFLTASINYFHAHPVRKYSIYADPMNPRGGKIEVKKKYGLSNINPEVGVGWSF